MRAIPRHVWRRAPLGSRHIRALLMKAASILPPITCHWSPPVAKILAREMAAITAVAITCSYYTGNTQKMLGIFAIDGRLFFDIKIMPLPRCRWSKVSRQARPRRHAPVATPFAAGWAMGGGMQGGAPRALRRQKCARNFDCLRAMPISLQHLAICRLQISSPRQYQPGALL